MTNPLQESRLEVPLPRDLIVLACIWIAGSWIMSIGLRSPVHPVAASYTDALLMMCILTMSGITIGWPLYRTSCTRFSRPYLQTGLDMLVLLCAIQVTVWPLRLLSTWSISHTAVIVSVLTIWILVSGAFVFLGASSARASVRTTAMLLAILLVAVGVVLPWGSGFPWWSSIDSAMAAVDLDSVRVSGDPVWTGMGGVVSTAIAAVGLWIIVLGARIAGNPSGKGESERVEST
jgi:hypothetical protein